MTHETGPPSPHRAAHPGPDDAAALVDGVYAVSLDPERVEDLMRLWEERIAAGGATLVEGAALFARPAFAGHLDRAAGMLDSLDATMLESVRARIEATRTAAFVIAASGQVLLANEPARMLGVSPTAPLPRAFGGDQTSLLDAVRRLVSGGPAADDVLRLDARGSGRSVFVHLSRIEVGPGVRAVLAVSNDHGWSAQAEEMLRRSFGVTPAEAMVMRRVVGGETVAAIARAAGRSEGTVRSQIHALLTKTGARSQLDLVRLSALVAEAVALRRPEPAPPLSANRYLRLDGAHRRSVDYMEAGAPGGRPFLWLMTSIGLSRWTASAERALAAAGMRMITPIRAGYAQSAQPPRDAPVLETALADMAALMDRLAIDRCPIVAPIDDIRIALMFARRFPGRVEGIVSFGAGFPIMTPEQYRRLHRTARFFRANARYAPMTLPFLTKLFRALIRRKGVPAYVAAALVGREADERAFADPEVAEAITAGFQLMMGDGVRCDRAFSEEVVAFHEDWPEGLGEVECPVVLMHGEEDGNAPIETARDYAALHPRWRLVSYPGEGQLVGYSRWRDLLDHVEAMMPARPAPRAS
jgi:pimeloyl-ACP methyl ester carboxylesterase/DNA-binding NarL/FixJ family response regulator